MPPAPAAAETGLVPQIVRPAHTPGIDWGSERLVLARVRGTFRELVWKRSYSRYGGRMTGTLYEPGSLRVYPDGREPVCRTLAVGGRLSRKLFAAHAAAIDAAFGAGVAARLDPRRTLWLDPLPAE